MFWTICEVVIAVYLLYLGGNFLSSLRETKSKSLNKLTKSEEKQMFEEFRYYKQFKSEVDEHLSSYIDFRTILEEHNKQLYDKACINFDEWKVKIRLWEKLYEDWEIPNQSPKSKLSMWVKDKIR